VDGWLDTEITTPKHDFWSIKKLIALDYYIVPFVKIMRSRSFSKWYYVDPFCGSGMLEFRKKYRFPGSPLIPLFHFNGTPFSGYHLSDIRAEYVSALKNRINKVPNNAKMEIYLDACNFSSKIEELFTGMQPQRWKETGYLVFLDPFGLDVDWESMERVLRSGPVDVIFTFMTWAMVWNKNNKLAEDKLTTYFGDNGWKKLRTQDDFVNHYCGKIQKLGYHENYKTFTIAVIQEGGKRYDVILATQSPGAANVLRDLKIVVGTVNTETINSAFAVTVGAKHT
jgi:three-Cys-motif partner protein